MGLKDHGISIHLAHPEKLDRDTGKGLLWRPKSIRFETWDGKHLIFAKGVHMHFGHILNGAVEALTRAESKCMIQTAGIQKVEVFSFQRPRRSPGKTK
jgi:hypothetical protein